MKLPGIIPPDIHVRVYRNGALVKITEQKRPLRLVPTGEHGVTYRKLVYPLHDGAIETTGPSYAPGECPLLSLLAQRVGHPIHTPTSADPSLLVTQEINITPPCDSITIRYVLKEGTPAVEARILQDEVQMDAVLLEMMDNSRISFADRPWDGLLLACREYGMPKIHPPLIDLTRLGAIPSEIRDDLGLEGASWKEMVCHLLTAVSY